MINFSLNTCWRLIPTKKKGSSRLSHFLFFFYIPFYFTSFM